MLVILPVTATHDLGVGALGMSQVEQFLGLTDGRVSRSLWQHVSSNACSIARSNALASNTAAELAIDLVAGLGTDSYSLTKVSGRFETAQEIPYHETGLSRATSKNEGDILAVAVAKIIVTRTEDLALLHGNWGGSGEASKGSNKELDLHFGSADSRTRFWGSGNAVDVLCRMMIISPGSHVLL